MLSFPQDNSPANVDFGNPLQLTVGELRMILRREAEWGGYPAILFDVISFVETRWKVDAVNLTGKDGEYGGSWGPMQMLYDTAMRLNFDCTQFNVNPVAAARAAVAYFDSQRPNTFKDALAYWNSGRKLFKNVPLENTCRTVYVPRALEALDWIMFHPPEVEIRTPDED